VKHTKPALQDVSCCYFSSYSRGFACKQSRYAFAGRPKKPTGSNEPALKYEVYQIPDRAGNWNKTEAGKREEALIGDRVTVHRRHGDRNVKLCGTGFTGLTAKKNCELTAAAHVLH